MSFEIKILDACIRFFSGIKTNCENILHDLQFMKYELQFGERDDDIYVATYLKSGTTWMQMILYQLTTPGEVNFRHIYDVSPWPRNSANRNETPVDLPSPRIIKTHDPYPKIPKGKKGRFIVVLRDGRDVAASLYHHRRNYNNNHLTFNENFEMSFRDKGEMNWFTHTQQWLINKNGHRILYVKYEDLQKNFERELYRIADFIQVKINPADLPRILERTSFAFMKQHEEKFGEQPPERKHETVYNQFIRKGQVGEGTSLMSSDDLEFYNRQFKLYLGFFDIMRPYLPNTAGNKTPPAS